MRDWNLASRIALVVGLIGSMITIVVFLTGGSSIGVFLDWGKTAWANLAETQSRAETQRSVSTPQASPSASQAGDAAIRVATATPDPVREPSRQPLFRPHRYPVSTRAVTVTATVDGGAITVPSKWAANASVKGEVGTLELSGSSHIRMSFVSPASFDFSAERARVKRRGYYKEVFYERERYGYRACRHWQYHARSSGSSQLRHVDVWWFPKVSSLAGVLVRSEFPTSDGRDDAAEVVRTASIVASFE